MAAESGTRLVDGALPDGRPDAPVATALHLLDGPCVLVGGRRRELPDGAGRLVVFVALRGRIDRRTAAGVLWPECGDARAAGNLRSALWRMRGSGIDLVDGDKTALWLRCGTTVDVHLVSEWAGRLIGGVAGAGDLDPDLCRPEACDLLPGWFDDWVIFERERLRQRVLHGIEALGRLLVRAGRADEAVVAARCAAAVDPLRESAQRVLVEAQVAAGDVPGALASYSAYRAAALRAWGAPPSAALAALVPVPPALERHGVAPAPAGRAPRTAAVATAGCAARDRMPPTAGAPTTARRHVPDAPAGARSSWRQP
jgi:DNA-binding SARP family transcriptional activator